MQKLDYWYYIAILEPFVCVQMNYGLVWFGLVCLVLWHINLCRLFNAKSIFM